MWNKIKKYLWLNKEKIIILIKDFIYSNNNKKLEIIESLNFKIHEVAVSGSYPKLAVLPTDENIIKNVNTSMEGMQKVRDTYIRKACLILSWFRNLALNTAVNGAKNSDHMKGLAIDFTAAVDLKAVYEKICKDKPSYIHKIIFYPSKNFIHISFCEKGKKEIFYCEVK